MGMVQSQDIVLVVWYGRMDALVGGGGDGW